MNTKTNNRHGRPKSSGGYKSSAVNKSCSGNFKHKKPSFNKFRKKGGHNYNKKNTRSGRKMPTFNPLQFINKNPVEASPETYTPKNTFFTFGLSTPLVNNIERMGLKTPSPIQDQIIPEILNGNDVIGLAETGTGKTAAFLIPLIEQTLKDLGRQTLILAPTRELAIQIEVELRNLARGLGVFGTVCVGGMNINPQIRALKRHNHFIIGTPGRVLDLIRRKHLITTGITTVVLDEADRMLDMGFINDMRAILTTTPINRETLLFSATIVSETKKLTSDFLKNPITVSVKKKDVSNSIAQDIVRYEHHNKFEELVKLFNNPKFTRVLIFGSMKHSVKKLSEQLNMNGISSESIHGNKSHVQRQQALNKFKEGRVRVLVATDVAARGIHVNDISHVINYDLPNTFEDYVHRIGRTGRAEKKGEALTFVSI